VSIVTMNVIIFEKEERKRERGRDREN